VDEVDALVDSGRRGQSGLGGRSGQRYLAHRPLARPPRPPSPLRPRRPLSTSASTSSPTPNHNLTGFPW